MMSKKIAIQGYRGSFHELAANKLFGKRPKELVYCKTSIDVFEALDSGIVDYALMAIGNNRYGDINHVYDVLVNNRINNDEDKYWICAEVYINIRHCLLAVEGVEVNDVHTVYSQAPAIVQCFGYLHKRLRQAIAVQQDDTALSAQLVKELNSDKAAAIASKEAGKIFGLEVIAEDIQDDVNNLGRFVLIQLGSVAVPKDGSKTSFLLNTKHRIGDLVKGLKLFADEGINISYLQSIPIPNRPFEYRFYIDIDAGAQESAVKKAIAGLNKLDYQYDIIGSYKRAELPKLRDNPLNDWR